jgi:hypothetical protein
MGLEQNTQPYLKKKQPEYCPSLYPSTGDFLKIFLDMDGKSLLKTHANYVGVVQLRKISLSTSDKGGNKNG